MRKNCRRRSSLLGCAVISGCSALTQLALNEFNMQEPKTKSACLSGRCETIFAVCVLKRTFSRRNVIDRVSLSLLPTPTVLMELHTFFIAFHHWKGKKLLKESEEERKKMHKQKRSLESACNNASYMLIDAKTMRKRNRAYVFRLQTLCALIRFIM